MKPIVLSSVDLSVYKNEFKILKKKSKFLLANNYLEIKNKIKNADIYVAYAKFILDKSIIDKANNLKFVINPATGSDHIDIKYLKKKNIIYHDLSKEYKLIKEFTATSELTFGSLICLIRNIIPSTVSVKKGDWLREKFKGFQLKDKVFGIIGYGRLGAITHKIAEGFQMKVIAYDIDKKKIKNKKIKVSLNHLLKKSDIITTHIHLTKKNYKIIDKNYFNKMKKGSIFINSSRGAIVNEKDLIFSLKSKRLNGAVLDVVDGEWLNKKKFKNHLLIKYAKKNNNLLITPHIGGSTIESIVYARKFVIKKIIKYLKYGSYWKN